MHPSGREYPRRCRMASPYVHDPSNAQFELHALSMLSRCASTRIGNGSGFDVDKFKMSGAISEP